MLKNLSIRLRLTLLSIFLLTICCFVLTFVLNFSANKMADIIEAMPLTPSYEGDEFGVAIPLDQSIVAIPATPASQLARQSFFNKSIFYMIAIVVLGGVITYYITGRALKPLSALRSQMKNRTVHNLSEDLVVPQSHDEIADLTCSFNEMTNKLGDAFEMQKRFSQSAAHELRTPLTVLKTKVEVFKMKNSHTPEEYDKLLDVISTHTNRLAELVTDLLTLTNMDAMELDDSINIKTLLSDIAEELSPLTIEKNINIKINADKPVIIKGNESLIHRALYNLIENAIKYNNQDGSVHVEITDEVSTNQAVISIKDTGIGIPPNLIENIFEPFFRVDKSRSRQMGGVGLGLSIVQSIIDKHNGTIDISKNSPCGTIFRVII